MASRWPMSMHERTPRTTCPAGLCFPLSPARPGCLPVSCSRAAAISIPWGYSQRVSAITIASVEGDRRRGGNARKRERGKERRSFRRQRVSIKMQARRDTARSLMSPARPTPRERTRPAIGRPVISANETVAGPRHGNTYNLYSNGRSFPHILTGEF